MPRVQASTLFRMTAWKLLFHIPKRRLSAGLEPIFAKDAPYKAQLRTESRRASLRTVSLPRRGRDGAPDRHGDRFIDRARHGARRRLGAIDARIAVARGDSDFDRAGRIAAGQLLSGRAGRRWICANSDGAGQS